MSVSDEQSTSFAELQGKSASHRKLSLLSDLQMAAGVDPEERRQEGRHDPPLPLPAAERLLPLFECLSKPDLLERCMSLGTSNANESLHSVIWRRASKAVFATRSTVEIAVAFGVVQFNCGGRVLLDASNAVITLPESSSNQLAVVAANMDRR